MSHTEWVNFAYRVIGAFVLFQGIRWAWDELVFYREWKQICDQAPLFTPFRAGHLPDDRGDAFGVEIQNEKKVPRVGTYAWIQIGQGSQLFRVKSVETLSSLGEKGVTRMPEVYLVVNEELTDEMIREVNKLSGFHAVGGVLPPSPARHASPMSSV